MHNNKPISSFRSEVIERAINIEWIVNAIISQHYFGKVMLHFLLDDYSAPNRPLIPFQIGHPFWSKSAGYSGTNQATHLRS